MKKVLSVITLESSAENFISDQLAYFQKNGDYECHLICSPHPNLEKFAKSNDFQAQAVQIERTLSPIKDIKAFFTILKYMRKNDFDVLIAHSFPKACLLSMTAGKMAAISHRIELAHGALQEGLSGIMKKLVILSERHNSRLSEVVISVSPSVALRRRQDRIDKSEKQRLLSKGTSNGVDAINKFNPDIVPVGTVKRLKKELGISENDFVIGFCGRLVRDKGIVELLDGFEELKKRHPEKSIKLLIIGNPEQRDALPQHTLDVISNSPDIIFTGRVDYDIIQNYYLPMEVFILPSYREGFPTVVLEASAMERPVITTRKTGCIDSIVENETGVFVDIEGTSIADGIEKFFDKNNAERMGKNGRKWIVDNFEHTVVREAMLNLLNEVTQKQ